VYVGIFAWRYGYIPDRDNPELQSITELELRHAERLGKECLIFLLNEDAPWERAKMEQGAGGRQITTLRDYLSKAYEVDFFQNRDDLARRVSTAMHNWEERNQRPDKSAHVSFDQLPDRDAQARSRAIIYDVLLLHSLADEQLAKQIADRLERYGRRLLRLSRGLFAEHQADFRELENHVRKCHTTLIVLSDATLSQMLERSNWTKTILSILRDRTGYLAVVCQTENSLQRAGDWEFSEIFDARAWDQTHGPTAIDVAQLDRAIVAHRPMADAFVVGLPVIVVAMTRAEAAQLDVLPETLEHTLGAPTNRHFQALRARIEERSAASFIERYDTARKGWKPFSGSSRTIYAVIEDVLGYLNSPNASTAALNG
jgi:hypothetical protein